MKKNSTKQKARKPFVYYDTIRNQTRGGLTSPGEQKRMRIGKYKVSVERAQRLDRYGNPVHTASVYDDYGRLMSSYRSNGPVEHTVSGALRRIGVETKRKTIKKRR